MLVRTQINKQILKWRTYKFSTYHNYNFWKIKKLSIQITAFYNLETNNLLLTNSHCTDHNKRGQLDFLRNCKRASLSKVLLSSLFFVLFIFIHHSRESELYRFILDGTSALAWELPFPRCLGHLSSI